MDNDLFQNALSVKHIMTIISNDHGRGKIFVLTTAMEHECPSKADNFKFTNYSIKES